MRSRPERRAVGALRTASVALLLLLSGLAKPAHAEVPPSFVLITLDTLRADHLGCYGYFRETSPALDAFAADALLFERAFAPMPTTLPSHVSLLTSTLPARHGVLSNFRFLQIPFASHQGLRSVSQILGEAGYETAAFTSASPLSRGTGIDVGFVDFDAPPPFAAAGMSVRRTAAETVDLALRWLDDATPPFFLWVHVFDPHLPYEPPAPYDQTFATDDRLLALLRTRNIPEVLLRHTARDANRYDGEIRFTDEQIGRLLDGLRRRGHYDTSAIAIAGDHGEGLLQHGEAGHERLWQGTIGVPLILRWPGGPRGVRNDRVASLIDVLPTLRAQTQLPLGSAAFDGRNLLPDARANARADARADEAVDGTSAADGGEAFAQEPFQSALPQQRTYALTTPRWKYWYLNDAPDRLYDLHEDRGETRDVLAANPEVADRLRQRVEEILERAHSQPGVEVSTDIDPALRERLEQLGYAE